jgi:hypothetical protein
VSTTISGTLVDTGRGQFRVAVADTDTASLAVARHVWDAKSTDAENETTLAQGSLDLRQEVVG